MRAGPTRMREDTSSILDADVIAYPS
jgi:hypothetical protein